MTTAERIRPFVQVLFFVSGATALIFQSLWLRGFSIILGSTVLAMSVVLAAFMLGMSIGGSLAARGIARKPPIPGRGALIYGVIELLLAAYASILTYVLFANQGGFIEFVAGFQGASMVSQIAVHFPLALVLMILPTIGMGITLPYLCTELPSDRDTPSLYALNLLGAAVGAVTTSFVFIYFFGVYYSALAAAALNVLVFAGAVWVSKQRKLDSQESAGVDEGKRVASETTLDLSRPTVLFLAFLSGFLFFAAELVWNRIFTLIYGNRIYVTSITLGFVLACLSFGALRVPRLLAKHSPRFVLKRTYAAAAVCLAAGVLFERQFIAENAALNGSLFTIIITAIPGTLMGMIFPMLLALPAKGLERGTHVGQLIAINTLGSVVGLVVVGYLLIGLLGTNRLIIFMLLTLLGCVAVIERRDLKKLLRPIPLLATGFCLFVGVFRWDLPLTKEAHLDRILVADEDEHCAFEIVEQADGTLSARCTGTDLVFRYGHPATQFVQETQAHVPMLVARSVDTVAVVGSGYGITAGAASLYEQVGRVDAIEILPQLVEHAHLFEPGNHQYHKSPKVKVHITDGRHFLARAPQPYDIISVNVSDPYLSGSASLFTEEFYSQAKDKLREGGILCQHVFGPDTVSLFHGFRRHFKYVGAFRAYDNGFTLIGSDLPIEVRNPQFLDEPRVREALKHIGIVGLPTIEAYLLEGSELVADLMKREPDFINKDVDPVLEFRRSEELNTLHSNL